MNVDNAAENSPGLHPPDVLVPLLWENTVGATFVCWLLSLVNFTAGACACFLLEC